MKADGLNALNTLALPKQLLRKTPTQKEKPWFFDNEPHEWHRDHDILDALIAGIGEHECPTAGEWIAFSIVGAIIATLTGKYIVPPEPEPFGWTDNLEHYIWEALWQTARYNKTKLNKEFVSAMLRSFLPREHCAPRNRPCHMSNFLSHWRSGEYTTDTLSHSVSKLRLCRIKDGRRSMNRLPEDVADSVKKVAQHVPTMLKIAIKRLQLRS